MVKNLLLFVLYAIAATANTKSLSLPSFLIEIPDDWRQTIEAAPGDDAGSILNVRDPNGVGILQIRAYDTGSGVDKARLRNLTNVESSAALTWQAWGDYSGYQHSYVDNGLFYRHWWLINGETILFITYQRDPELTDMETELIEGIIQSLTVNNT